MKSFTLYVALLAVFASADVFPDAFGEPVLYVEDLVVEEYVPNLCCLITTMTFLGDDILVLQKMMGKFV